MSHDGNAAAYFVDRHTGEGRSEKVAFREASPAGRELTYGGLSDRSGRIAAALLEAGIRREDRAVMLLLDQIEFPQIFWGCLKAGVVAVPLNTLLSTAVYEVILKDCRAQCLFVSEELLPTVAPLLANAPFLQRAVVVGKSAPEGAVLLEEFVGDCEPMATVEASPDEVAFWLYSSGSTGQPKGVRHVHSSLKSTADSYGRQVLGIREDDVVYSAAKLFFAYGLGNAMTFPLAVGATSILFAGRPTPDAVLDILTTQRPSIFCGVPTLYAALVAHLENLPTRPDAGMRSCISAGEALPEDIGKSWRDMWGIDILDGVGTTELLHIFLSNRPGDIVYGTSGIAVPGYELRLVDESGIDVPVGQVGELLVRGESAADSYWNQRKKSRTTFEGEWTRTGDKYELTEEGRFVYCGRTDDLFKVSGIWVSPFEVEQALIAHQAVLEAAVVATRDEEGLEKPKAFIVLKEAAGSDDLTAELKDFVKDRIGKWKYPRWVEFVPELPKTATGKIQRYKLRDAEQ